MKIDKEYIIAQLNRRAAERQLPRVAEGSNIDLRTIHRIKIGKGCRITTAEILQTFLKNTERRKTLAPVGSAASKEESANGR